MYKTYIMIILAVAGLILYLAGVIDWKTLELWLVITGFGSLAGLRDAIKKLNAQPYIIKKIK